MKNSSKACFVIALYLVFSVASAIAAPQYEALKGVRSAKAIFDVRMGSPKSAALHLSLIHQTFRDLSAAKKQPVFAVVFIGPAVKLISKNREGFAPEDLKSLDEIAETITAMSKDGIGLEICLVAAKVFKVDPATVLPEITSVENGWFSVIGYQTRDYALVPVY
jgi:intracellular sulfur oxidation DsrE/DsrF family protein